MCTDPTPQPALAATYSVVFIIVMTLVMMSLFVGTVTMSMSESMSEMKAEQEEADRVRRLKKQMKKMSNMGEPPRARATGARARAARRRPDPHVRGARRSEQLEMRNLLSELVDMDDQAMAAARAARVQGVLARVLAARRAVRRAARRAVVPQHHHVRDRARGHHRRRAGRAISHKPTSADLAGDDFDDDITYPRRREPHAPRATRASRPRST